MYHRRSIYQGEATRQNINKEKGRKKRERKGQTTEERGEFVQREKDEDDRKANSGIIYHLVLAIEQRAFCFSIFIHRLICPRSLSLSLSTWLLFTNFGKMVCNCHYQKPLVYLLIENFFLINSSENVSVFTLVKLVRKMIWFVWNMWWWEMNYLDNRRTNWKCLLGTLLSWTWYRAWWNVQ